MSYKEAVTEFASLPRVSDLRDATTRRRVALLLEHLDTVIAEKHKLEQEEEELKNELEKLQTDCEVPGFRLGLLCYMAAQVKGRRTIDSDRVQSLLLEYGLPPDQLPTIWKEGKPSTRQTFRRLPEEE